MLATRFAQALPGAHGFKYSAFRLVAAARSHNSASQGSRSKRAHMTRLTGKAAGWLCHQRHAAEVRCHMLRHPCEGSMMAG